MTDRPTTGGRHWRDPKTGRLVAAPPAEPATEPATEPAAPPPEDPAAASAEPTAPAQPRRK